MAKSVPFPQPCLIVAKSGEEFKYTYVATEGQVLCKVPAEKAPFVLLCVFYALNMQYTHGCTNFYSFLEHLFLDISPPKRSKLHFITTMTNISV